MTRQLFLRLMLVALAASALMAIVSIYADTRIAWRIMGSTILAAVTCGLMIPVAPREGTSGMDLLQRTVFGYLVIAFAVSMVMTWDLSSDRRGESLFWIWMMVGVPSLTIAVMALRNRRREDRSLALAERVAITGAYATMAITTAVDLIAFSPYAGIEESLLVGFACVGGTVVASCSAIGQRRVSLERLMPLPSPAQSDRALGSLGIWTGIAWTVLSIISVFERAASWSAGMPTSQSQLLPIAVMSMTVALPCAIWCGLGISRVTGFARYLRHSSAASALALGVVLSYVNMATAWFGETFRGDTVGRLIGALIVVGISSLLAAFVTMRLSMGRRIAAEPIESLDWICPRCATRTTIAMGEHSCAGCGLCVQIDLRDDRCPACAYDLRGQPAGASTCPECGRPRQMPASLRSTTLA